jgi:DNA-binding Xre family transcriptional regulator
MYRVQPQTQYRMPHVPRLLRSSTMPVLPTPTQVIARRIDEARIAKGFTQADLARATGISCGRLYLLLRRRRRILIVELCQIAAALELSATDLFPDESCQARRYR